MVRRNVSELRAGMVLAEDVLTPGGRFLMPKGTTLDHGHLKSLLAWNLPDVGVMGEVLADAPPPVSDEAAVAAAAEAAVAERLCLLDPEHPLTPLLHRLALAGEIRRRKAASGDAPAAPPHDHAPRPVEDAPPPMASPDMLLRDEPKLVSPPEVYLRISEVLRDPASTVEDAAASIRHDPSLAAKLLRLVNSPFYARTMRAVRGRFPSKVDSLSRAVVVVGGRQLATLALGVSVLPLFQDIPPHWVNMRVFWEHSVGCAVAAQAIASALGREGAEAAFVAGLLHDIGRIVLFKQASAHMAAAMRRAAAGREPLYLAERELLGFDHAALGGLLLQKWQFPANLEKMVRYHHDLDEPLFVEEPAIVHLADCLATAMGWGASGNRHVARLSPAAWDSLGLGAEDVARLLPGMEARLAETMHSFFPDRQP
ncbi:HDOD domain-containing protein [Solidesulfovibrio sp.]|uniref:HDOD domain-containing protein n=1 Tax=Solidesulfovibrio sp. TaxID=2910990 RepID=UPI0026126EBD|nr:HDOD domain-containing protein [Solidesulfovibrio sp.]